MQDDNPLVSVIIPAYNVEKYVREAVESILNQSYRNIELLIADDGSTDKTCEIIESFKDERIKFFKNDRNLNRVVTAQNLFAHSTGALITFQDADDFSRTDRIEVQVKEFLADKDLSMCGAWMQIVDKNGKYIATHTKKCSYSEIKESIESSNQFGGSTIMIRRKVIEQLGLYRIYFQNLSYFDYDYTYLICDSFKCINVPAALYFYRQHASSLSKQVSIKRLTSFELVKHFGKQRKMYGQDDLMKGRYDLIEKFLDKVEEPFKKDKSLVFRKYSESFMYNKLYIPAIKTAARGIYANPFKSQNYRTLIYCLRKSLIRLL